jgi:hypothetical protein
MLLNPRVQLNLRGLSVDHTVSEGVLTDICQPSDQCPVDLSNPDLKAFDPWAPFVAEDSEATESDVRDGDAAGVQNPEKDAEVQAEAVASPSGTKDTGFEAETDVPPLGP